MAVSRGEAAMAWCLVAALALISCLAGFAEGSLVKHYVSVRSEEALVLRPHQVQSSVLRMPAAVFEPLKGLEQIEKISVVLHNLRHPQPEGLSIVVESPTGAFATLMYSCGARCDLVRGATLTFDEESPNSVHDMGFLCTHSPVVPSTFELRTGICAGRTKPFAGHKFADAEFRSLATFAGQPLAGEWKLWIFDSSSSDRSASSSFGFDSWGIESVFVTEDGSSIDQPHDPWDNNNNNNGEGETEVSLTPGDHRGGAWRGLTQKQREDLMDDLSRVRPNRFNNATNGDVEPGVDTTAVYDFDFPTVTFYASPGGSLQSNLAYEVVIESLQELDVDQNVVSTFTVPTTGYVVTNPSQGTHVYSTTLNSASVQFNFTYYSVVTILQFAGASFATSGDSTILTVRISNWPFQLSSQYLQLSVRLNPIQGTLSQPSIINGNPLTTVAYNANGFVAQYSVLRRALLDGVVSTNVGLSVNGNTASFTFDRFSTSLDWDPDFSLLVNNQNKEDDSGGTEGWVIAVAVVVPVAFCVVVCVILIAIIATLLSRAKFRRALKRRGHDIINWSSDDLTTTAAGGSSTSEDSDM